MVVGAIAINDIFYQLFTGARPTDLIDLILGLSVFLIYNIDRQIDNFISKNRDELHVFHAKYQMVLRGIILCLSLFLGILLFRVEFPILQFGLGLGLLILLYWYGWVKHIFDRIWGSKEILTALIYSVGVMLPTCAFAPFSMLLLGSIVELFLLALLNLWLFTLISDGGQWRRWIVLAVCSFVGILALVYMELPIGYMSILLFIWGIHVGIYYFRARMPERYLGDLAFLSPLIYLICPL